MSKYRELNVRLHIMLNRVGENTMSNEPGGRGGKSGDTYERKHVLRQIIEVLREDVDYVTHEPLGNDEDAVDSVIGHKNGSKELQQCKSRNQIREYWSFSSVNSYNLFERWGNHLEFDQRNEVALVSPLPFTMLEDLCSRARKTSDNPDGFWNFQLTNNYNVLVNNLCGIWKLDRNNAMDRVKIVNFLQRTHIKQNSDGDMKDQLISWIDCLFLGSPKDVYNTFMEAIAEGEMWSKTINLQFLHIFLAKNQIVCRNLSNDRRVKPAIDELNRLYKEHNKLLEGGLVYRKEFADCENIILRGASAIVHGKAGNGKSGCAQRLVSFCEENNIHYVAVRLDHKEPSENPELWGKKLGLPASIPHSINSISGDQKAVIIFDQLDALRWTSAHSSDALQVCSQIIKQVEALNLDRVNKISLILVCRTIDMETDPALRSLYEKKHDETSHEDWEKIEVGAFDDETVQQIVGEVYKSFTSRLKKLLSSPSNLYIWQHLDQGEMYSDCSTTSNLIYEWWRQLLYKASSAGISERDMQSVKEKFASLAEIQGKYSFPRKLMSGYDTVVDFLSSGGLLSATTKSIEFFHQSALDCFVAEKMMNSYVLDNKAVMELIGSTEFQTPFKRYQVQILLQDLLDTDPGSFLKFGQELTCSDIRFMIKSVFFDVFSQISPDLVTDDVKCFIVDYCENGEYSGQFINNVVFSRHDFIRILLQTGIIDKWKSDNSKWDIAIRLITVMQPNYAPDEIGFIRKHALSSLDDAQRFSYIFTHDIAEGSDAFFELGLEYFEKFPQMLENKYIDFNKSFSVCAIRCAKILALTLKVKNKRTRLRFSEIEWTSPICSTALKGIGHHVLNILLPCVPLNLDDDYDWRNIRSLPESPERACVEIIICAAIDAFGSNYDGFWDVFNPYAAKGVHLYNEIILSILPHLPKQNSDQIITYLCSDFNKTLFEKTSNNKNELLLAKEVVKIHSVYCSDDIFAQLEKTICAYISPKSKDRLRDRIEYNRDLANNRAVVYWSFWGGLQHELLSVLPCERINRHTYELQRVLKRKYHEQSTEHNYYTGHGGGVISSPVSGKTLSNNQWLRIIFSKKILSRDESRRTEVNWIEVPGGFVESNLEQFASTFRVAVADDPERMVKLFLSQARKFPDIYVASLSGGVAFSEKLKDVSSELLEEMILRFWKSHTSDTASDICTIIGKRSTEDWSQAILEILDEIVSDYVESDKILTDVKPSDSFQSLENASWNVIKGEAALAISRLIWDHEELVPQFKDAINKLTKYENPAIRLASLSALYAGYNYDPNWILTKCFELFESDFRLVGYKGALWILFRIYYSYPKYKARIFSIVESCYNSGDESLIRQGACWKAESYIVMSEFPNLLEDVDNMSVAQAESVIRMASAYFGKDEYVSTSKVMYTKFFNSSLDLEHSFSRLFYDKRLNLDRDKDFIISLMKSKFGKRMLHLFAEYMISDAATLFNYSDIILAVSHHMLENLDIGRHTWSLEKEIPTLLIRLYDETAASSLEARKDVAQKCLDLWDIMFEKQIGNSRNLAKKMLDD